MSLYSVDNALSQPLTGVEVLDFGPGLSPTDFQERVESLLIPTHFALDGPVIEGTPATVLGNVTAMSRTPDTPREPWAPDHHWHSDRTYWGENQFATVLYAQRMIGRVASTELIDTSILLQVIETDMPGITEELGAGLTVFTVARYYSQILATKGSPDAIQRTLASKGEKTLRAVARAEERRYPPKKFPTIAHHPLRLQHCIMVDGVRAVRFTNVTEDRSRDILECIEQRYLDLPPEELAGRPYYFTHEWEEGQVLLFPQIGTLHRAGASPPQELRRDTLRLFIR